MPNRVTGLITDVATSDRVRRVRGRARRALQLPGSTIVRPAPSDPDPIPSFRLFALLGSWMEADVIEACVRNALTQGCEEVYLVDNDSPDDTVDVAVRAGAQLAVSFATNSYNESMRCGIMSEVAREVSARAGDEHIWWLWLDTDEFPQGPHGLTIREHLASLDRRFRVVGARFFDHYPSQVPAYVSGRHPIDDMPWCTEDGNDFCGNGLHHYKHPLVRFDRGGPAIEVGNGAHSVRCRRAALFEPPDSLLVHHFKYREESATRARLGRLCGVDAGPDTRVGYQVMRQREAFGSQLGVAHRLESLDGVYAKAKVGPKAFGPEVRRWEDLAGPGEADIPRWY
jgi:hypothetical protein